MELDLGLHELGVVGQEGLELGAVGAGLLAVVVHGVLPGHQDEGGRQVALHLARQVGQLFVRNCPSHTVYLKEGPSGCVRMHVCVCVCVCVHMGVCPGTCEESVCTCEVDAIFGVCVCVCVCARACACAVCARVIISHPRYLHHRKKRRARG